MKLLQDIKLFLSIEIIEELKMCVDHASPNEACGLIFGEIKEIKLSEGEGFQYFYLGKKFKCFESDKKSPVSFLINNFEKLNSVFKDAAEEFKLRLISIFHSHPSGSYPSGVDLNNMKFLDNCGLKSFKYQIWTIMDASNKKLNGYIYFNKEISQIDIEIQNK